jgi:hypothetical protein
MLASNVGPNENKDDMVALAPDTTNEKGNDAYIAHTQHMDR